LHLISIVNPWNAKLKGSFWLNHSLQDFRLTVNGAGIKDDFKRRYDFVNGLEELWLVDIPSSNFAHKVLDKWAIVISLIATLGRGHLKGSLV
jgi:hypothetical protein